MTDQPDLPDLPPDDNTTPQQPKRRKRSTGRGATRNNSPSSPMTLFRRERDLRALQLRRAGATWDQIARATQAEDADPPWPARYETAAGAYRAVMRLVAELPKEDAEQWRALLTDRCEAVVREMSARLRREPDTSKAARAATTLLRAVRQLQLLHVPELAQQVEVTVLSEFEMALRDLHQEIAMRAAAEGSPPVPVE